MAKFEIAIPHTLVWEGGIIIWMKKPFNALIFSIFRHE